MSQGRTDFKVGDIVGHEDGSIYVINKVCGGDAYDIGIIYESLLQGLLYTESRVVANWGLTKIAEVEYD